MFAKGLAVAAVICFAVAVFGGSIFGLALVPLGLLLWCASALVP